MTRTIRTSFAIALFSLLGMGAAIAQGARFSPAPRPNGDDNIGVGIEQLGVLAYPPTLLYKGIDSGEVRISISVDKEGNLMDSLVTAYTEREFADAALAAIKRWRYQPAKAGGNPTASRSDLLFQFRNAGVIVQTLPGAEMRRVYFSTLNERYQYKPCQLRDLDRIPTPVRVISPMVNSDEKTHRVTVEFFIDEEGGVRMAAVSREEAGNIYAAAAVAAVEQWRFESPLRKGERVLVLAQQEFNFHPKK